MEFWMQFWLVFLIATVITLFTTPLAIRIAPKIGAMDIPKDERRIHTKAMPRFGGMAIFLGITISAIVVIMIFTGENMEDVNTAEIVLAKSKMIKILLIGTIIYALGVIDDLKDLSPYVKFAVQTGCGIMVYAVGVRMEFITILGGRTDFAAAASFIITVLWVVGITNTVNLIDGVDGLAAGIVVIASFCISYAGYIHGSYLICLLMLCVAGGGMGFLPYNFYPAKVFMGDGGSLFMGYCLACFSLQGYVKGATFIAVIIPVLVLTLPIIDTIFAIFRRMINKKPIMGADKGHIHHRLLRAGMGQRRTVLTMYGVCGVMGVAAVLFSRRLYVETAGLTAIAFMFIYIVLTDADKWIPKVKEKKKEKRKVTKEKL